MESFRSLFLFESTPVEFTIRVRVMLSRTFCACSCFFALRVCSGMRTVFLQLVPESSILVQQVSAGSSSALEAFHFDGWSRTSIHYSYASGCQEKFWAEVKLCWRLYCRIVLKKSLTAGGASVASLERRPPAAWSCGMEGGEERKQCHAERSLWEAEPHKGVSEPAVGTWCLFARVEHGLPLRQHSLPLKSEQSHMLRTELST